MAANKSISTTQQENKLKNIKPDFSDLKGQPILKRSLEICAAGNHSLLLFGPSDSEKNIAISVLSGICLELQNRDQHVLQANPCPCGNLGIEGKACLCSNYNLKRYWRTFDGISLDSIDMRVPVKPVDPACLLAGESESNKSFKKRVEAAVLMQKERFVSEYYSRNARIPFEAIKKYCRLDDETRVLFSETNSKLSLSSKARHSVLKIARTIADLNRSRDIERDHFLEAVYYRRYGDRDIFWNEM